MDQSRQVNGAALAQALAARLADVVPPSVSIEAGGPAVSVLKSGKLWVTSQMPEILDDASDPRTVVEKLELACERVLNAVQDFVSEDLATPWPDSTKMQLPGAEVTEGRIRLWYGDPNSPELELEPIFIR